MTATAKRETALEDYCGQERDFISSHIHIRLDVASHILKAKKVRYILGSITP